MKWTEITEGAELYCPNCNDYMGKPSENDENVTCSNCGEQFHNNGGIRRNKMPDVKFGRLVLTDLENEEGCIQGMLKTGKGANLGRLTQYGPRWHDYDDGKWEAYCIATKGNKKGFPDQKKAVEWIVRQTRVAMKTKTESLQEAKTDMVFGHSVPNWANPDHHDDALVFTNKDGRECEIYANDNKMEMFVAGKHVKTAATTGDVEKILTKYRYTRWMGVQMFSGAKDQFVAEGSGMFMDCGASMPDWTKEDDVGQVLCFQKPGRFVDMRSEAQLHRNKYGITMIVDNSYDMDFKDEASAEKWLKHEGYTDFIGVDRKDV